MNARSPLPRDYGRQIYATRRDMRRRKAARRLPALRLIAATIACFAAFQLLAYWGIA